MSNKKIFLVIFLFLAVLAIVFLFLFGAGNKKETKIYHIGLLQMASTVNANMEGFKAGMETLGYKEGENVFYDYKNAEGDVEKLKEYTKKFVDDKVDLIFTNTSPATQAAKEATKGTAIPVVFSMVADPVGAGFVASIQSSDNNLSGTSCAYIDIASKRLEALKSLSPRIKKVMVFYRPGDKSGEPATEEIKKAAKKLDIGIIDKPVLKSDEIKQILSKIQPGEIDAIMDPADSMVTASVDLLVEESFRLKVPLMMLSDREAEKGALISYGVDYFDLGNQSAALADKILKGVSPTEIPIQMPRIFRIVLNLKTASQIGLVLPGGIVDRADRVIK